MRINKPVATLGALCAISIGVVSPSALAGGETYPPPPAPTKKAKCNSGNGNGSEYVNSGKCTNGDPGNSWNAGNRGGDEISRYPGSVPNPGGNNAP